MTEQDFQEIIAIVRSAPLVNMEQAEFRAKLLDRFAQHARQVLESLESKSRPLTRSEEVARLMEND